MSRTLVVATSEFLALVKTKAFIIGLLMMPVIFGAAIGFQVFAAKHVDTDAHPFVVIDHSGQLFAPLASAADTHNQKSGPASAPTGPYFLPSAANAGDGSMDDLKLALSERVRRKEIFAFVEIPANILDLDPAKAPTIDYYTETPSYTKLPDWIESTLEKEIAKRKFTAAAVDPALVAKLTRHTDVSTLGLVARNTDGTIRQAKEANPLETYALPFGMMYLLFIALMSSAPPLLNAVIEEKMSKISEVLLASVTPFQLMMGKLIGVACVSVLLALVYFAGGIYAAFTTGHWEFIHPALLGWFLLFLVCAVLMFGSVFVAIGSACSDLKDAQSMMQPVMLLLMMPLFVSPVVINDPTSTIAVVVSLVPTATPFIMLLRLAMTPAPPMWQVGLSVILVVAATLFLVWAASRIFRVGLLMQGKAPNLPELWRWIWA